MKAEKLNKEFGTGANNRIDDAGQSSVEGALACLETFYYCFNHKDLDTFRQIWSPDELVQVDNPLGGIIRGRQSIIGLYSNLFNSKASVWVKLTDIVCYASESMAVFAGTEVGEFTSDKETIPLTIRTTRVFVYDTDKERWFHLHHHGSIDNADLLQQYQQAVKK